MNIKDYKPSAELLSMLQEEEMYVAWPYDDKGPWRNGAPVEYKGGKLKGTLTQGYGHTAAAGGRKIVLGVHWSRAEALEVFKQDIARFLPQFKKIGAGLEGTQGQFDAIFSAYYNLTTSSFKKLIAPWKAGNPQGTYDKFPLYVMSGGERMAGLVRRREREMQFWNGYHLPKTGVNIGGGKMSYLHTSATPEQVDDPDAMTKKQKIAVGTAVVTAASAGGAVVENAGSISSTLDSILPVVSGINTLIVDTDIRVLLALVGISAVGFGAYYVWSKFKK